MHDQQLFLHASISPFPFDYWSSHELTGGLFVKAVILEITMTQLSVKAIYLNINTDQNFVMAEIDARGQYPPPRLPSR